MTEEGFKNLFETYFEEIRKYIFFSSGDAGLSTDIAQETFIKIWENQIDLDPEEDLALIYRIANNLLISHYRRETLSRKFQSELDLEMAKDHEQDIFFKELKNKYKKALMKLPEKQRIVFMMSRVEKFTYREIADRLDISVKAVEKRMNRALNFLRKELNYK